MCINPEIINFVSGRQYKSISYVEKLKDTFTMKELYDYDLHLQTRDKLSNTVNIFLTNEDIKNCIVDPINTLIEKKNKINLEPIEISVKNVIGVNVFPYYSINNLLPDGYLRNKAKYHGCIYYANFKYTLEDKKFIKIESSIQFRCILFKFKPRCIQPKTIILSLDEAEELSLMIQGTL